MKKLLPMLLFFLVPVVSFAQGSIVNDIALKNLVTGIAPAAGATVTVCTSAGTGIPCTPLATVYSDIALTLPLTNPLTADSNGYYSFYAAPGRYVVTITGAGTSGRSITYILPSDTSGNNNFTGNNTHSGTETFTGSIIPKNIDNALYVSGTNTVSDQGWAGSDIGAWLNAAYAALPTYGGTIFIAQRSDGGGCYTQTTQAAFTTLNKPVLIAAIAPGTIGNAAKTAQTGTCINWPSIAGTSAIVVDWGNSGGDTSYANSGGFKNLVLVNNQCVTNGGCSSSASGIQVGGINAGARGLIYEDTSIMGFGKGIQISPDTTCVSWGLNFNRGSIAFNTTGISYERNCVGENDTYTGVKFVSNGKHFDVPAAKGMDITILGGSLDSAITCGINNAGTSYVNAIGVHWENAGASLSTLYTCDTGAGLQLRITDGQAFDDVSGGSSANNWFSSSVTHVNGLYIFGGLGGRTYSGKVFNLGAVGYINVWNGAPTAFPSSTICNLAVPCFLTNINNTASVANPTAFSGPGVTAPAGAASTTQVWIDSGDLRLWEKSNNGVSQHVTMAGVDINAGDQVAAAHIVAGAGVDWAEGTAPAAASGHDTCYGDSTAHALECSYNNGTFGVVPLLNRVQTWTAAQTHTGAAIIPDQTSGITGTTTNNNANAGAVGEYVQSVLATGSSVTLATGVTSNVTSISLTAGDWDVTGAVDFTFGATTSYTNLIGSVSSTSATIGAQDSKFDFETPAAVPTAGADAVFSVPVVRFSLSGTTTVFLVAQGTFTVSTLKAYGTIRARRVR